jgi:hypothetical protein
MGRWDSEVGSSAPVGLYGGGGVEVGVSFEKGTIVQYFRLTKKERQHCDVLRLFAFYIYVLLTLCYNYQSFDQTDHFITLPRSDRIYKPDMSLGRLRKSELKPFAILRAKAKDRKARRVLKAEFEIIDGAIFLRSSCQLL